MFLQLSSCLRAWGQILLTRGVDEAEVEVEAEEAVVVPAAEPAMEVVRPAVEQAVQVPAVHPHDMARPLPAVIFSRFRPHFFQKKIGILFLN